MINKVDDIARDISQGRKEDAHRKMEALKQSDPKVHEKIVQVLNSRDRYVIDGVGMGG